MIWATLVGNIMFFIPIVSAHALLFSHFQYVDHKVGPAPSPLPSSIVKSLFFHLPEHKWLEWDRSTCASIDRHTQTEVNSKRAWPYEFAYQFEGCFCHLSGFIAAGTVGSRKPTSRTVLLSPPDVEYRRWTPLAAAHRNRLLPGERLNLLMWTIEACVTRGIVIRKPVQKNLLQRRRRLARGHGTVFAYLLHPASPMGYFTSPEAEPTCEGM